MPKTISEHTLVADLIKELKKVPHFVVEKHADRFKYGTPDLCVTGLGFVSRWEVKYANPDFESEGIQELTCKRLAKYGYCRYIIFFLAEGKGTIWASIVKPEKLSRWQEPQGREFCLPVNLVAEFIIGVHHEHARQ